MYLLCFVLFAISILGESASQETSEIDFSQPITPEEYRDIIKQGFATDYFRSKAKPVVNYMDWLKHIEDVYDKGFRNVRLRSRADYYDNQFDGESFKWYLMHLKEMVKICVGVGVAPIISWVHHKAEAYGTEDQRQYFLTWWRRVAETLKDESYHLAFNLFTELGMDVCEDECDESLTENIAKYNEWTSEVVRVIRATGGNNANRILILSSPKKVVRGLDYIDKTIFMNDHYMMVEWHDYAAGPNQKILSNDKPSRRFWEGNGNEEQKKNLRNAIDEAKKFDLLSYFGAWMPRDNKDGALNEEEVISFAQFFVTELKQANIPWSLNALKDYYDIENNQWITVIQDLKGAQLNMSRVLESIQAVM